MHEAIIFANGYGDDADGKEAAAHAAMWYELTQGPIETGHMRDNRIPWAFSQQAIGLPEAFRLSTIHRLCRIAGYKDAAPTEPIRAPRPPKRKREPVTILEV